MGLVQQTRPKLIFFSADSLVCSYLPERHLPALAPPTHHRALQMALAALASQLGPSVSEFKGEYVWKPAVPCCCFSGTGTLVAVDRNTLEWEDAKGLPCGPLHPVHRRDSENPNHFVGVGDGCTCYPACAPCGSNTENVWVFEQPNEPLKFYSSREEALKRQAPSIVAMRREKSPARKKEESMPPGARRVADGSGMDGKARERVPQYTEKQREQQFKQQLKQEAKDAERMQIAESITFDKQKREKAARKKAALDA